MRRLVEAIGELLGGQGPDLAQVSVSAIVIHPVGRVRFDANANGKGWSSAVQYQFDNMSRFPQSVEWRPGARIPRGHHRSRYGNR